MAHTAREALGPAGPAGRGLTAARPGRAALTLAALLVVLVTGGLLRPLLPVDETRYAAVAWEMWTRGDFLVPHLHGQPYHHKPPLLFWLVHAGWAVFGVNDWWPRLVSPLFAAGALALTAWIARALWPDRPEAARTAPFVLLATPMFLYFATALMFDAMLACFVALGWAGLVRAWQTGCERGFGWLTLGLGGALLAKGPVALVHLLPLALLAPWWMRERRPPWRRWYAGVGLAVLGGAAIVLAWAVPAGIAGGPGYREAIFWRQSAGRIVASFAHVQPWWYYLAMLPLMAAPWLAWPRWWGGARRAMALDSGARFAALGFAAGFVLFSAMSGKVLHYLLPEFVLLALLVARGLPGGMGSRASQAVPALTLLALGGTAAVLAWRIEARYTGLDAAALAWAGGLAAVAGLALVALRPADAAAQVRRSAVAMVVAACALLVAFDSSMREAYDTSAVGRRLARYEREGRPVAVAGGYHAQWTFAGRLRRPLEAVDPAAVPAWLAAHPGGRVVLIHRRKDAPAPARVEYDRRYRGRWLSIVALDEGGGG